MTLHGATQRGCPGTSSAASSLAWQQQSRRLGLPWPPSTLLDFIQGRLICRGISFCRRGRLPAGHFLCASSAGKKGNSQPHPTHPGNIPPSKKNMQCLQFLTSLPWEGPHWCLRHLFLRGNVDAGFWHDPKSHFQYLCELAVLFLTFQASLQLTSRLKVFSPLRSVFSMLAGSLTKSFPNCISLFPQSTWQTCSSHNS